MKQLIGYGLAIGVGLFFCGCTTSFNYHLDKKSLVFNNCSEQELRAYNDILYFFDNVVIRKTGLENINSAYHVYSQMLKNTESIDDIIGKLGFGQDELSELESKLKKMSFYSEIWNEENGRDYDSGDIISISVSPNITGRYFSLLENIVRTRSNEYLNDYLRGIKDCSCIPPPIAAGFHLNHEELDFSKPEYRLIWAIHFITISSRKEIP